MNQSIYDITDVIGRDVAPLREAFGEEITAQYLRNVTHSVLLAISNPAWNPAESLTNAMTDAMILRDRTGISQMTAMVFQRLYHFLKGLPFERESRVLTVLKVEITPVSYQLTLGHVA